MERPDASDQIKKIVGPRDQTTAKQLKQKLQTEPVLWRSALQQAEQQRNSSSQ
jgi:hypothetical protein